MEWCWDTTLKQLRLEGQWRHWSVFTSWVFSQSQTRHHLLARRTRWWSNLLRKNKSHFWKKQKRRTNKMLLSLCCLQAEVGGWWLPEYFLPSWILNSLINSSPGCSRYTTKSACSKLHIVASAASAGLVIKWLLDHWVPGLNSFSIQSICPSLLLLLLWEWGGGERYWEIHPWHLRDFPRLKILRVEGNLEGVGDGFTNSTQVLLEYRHSLIINPIPRDGSRYPCF